MVHDRADYENPLEDSTHEQHGLYQLARRTQNAHQPGKALPLWEELASKFPVGAVEHVEASRQKPVCKRLLGEDEEAERLFLQSISWAEAIHPVLVARVVRDYSALQLERGEFSQATSSLEGMLDSLPTHSPDWYATLAYLGRTRGRNFGRGRRACKEMRQAFKGLRRIPGYAALCSDICFWIMELAWWHCNRFVYAFKILPAVCRGGWAKSLDWWVTLVGGYHGRRFARRALAKLTSPS